jgi:hypothetical protein
MLNYELNPPMGSLCMSNLTELIDHTHDLTTAHWAFLICAFALAVAWKALDLVGRSQRKNHRRGPHE